MLCQSYWTQHTRRGITCALLALVLQFLVPVDAFAAHSLSVVVVVRQGQESEITAPLEVFNRSVVLPNICLSRVNASVPGPVAIAELIDVIDIPVNEQDQGGISASSVEPSPLHIKRH